MHVKICGNLREEDVQLVASLHPDFMGWILSPRSPRRIGLDAAGRLIEQVRATAPQIRHLAVLAENTVAEIDAARERLGSDFDYLQWTDAPPDLPAAAHGRVVPAIRVRATLRPESLDSYPGAPFFVLDSHVQGMPGGTGRRLEAAWVSEVRHPFLLAGGLRPENLAEAWDAAPRAFGVDVSSGLERSPGVKDHDLVRAFVRLARSLPAHPQAAQPAAPDAPA